MVNEGFRKALDLYAKDLEEEIIVLDNHAYDNSIIGITEDGRVMYSYDKMVEEYVNDESCDLEEALEWIDYNTIRAIPYMGEKAPIIIYDTVQSILEHYGE